MYSHFFQQLLSEISALDSGLQSLRGVASSLLCDGNESGRAAVTRLLSAVDKRLNRLKNRSQVGIEVCTMLGWSA